MPKKSPPSDKSTLGAEAKALIANPTLRLAFSNLEARLTRQLLNTRVEARDDRERLYTMIQLNRLVVTELHKAIADAEVEARRQTRKDESK